MMTNKLYLLFFCAILTAVKGQIDKAGPIRLYDPVTGSAGAQLTNGIVQVYMPNDGSPNWINICAGIGGDMKKNADVICHQLGYKESISTSTAGAEGRGLDNSPSLINDLSCTSSDFLVIHQCSYILLTLSEACDDHTDLVVNCSTVKLQDDPFDTMVRITDGPTVAEGRIEVYCNNKWGTVCWKDQSVEAAGFVDIVCQQLGYTNALNWNHLNRPGQANQTIWMKDVSCSLNKYYQCVGGCQMCPKSDSSAITSCNHTSDMTIRCGYETADSQNNNNQVDTCVDANNIISTLSAAVTIAIVVCSVFCCITCIVISVVAPICIYCCCCKNRSAGGVQGKAFNYANFDYDSSNQKVN